jgi:hypothetical protein
MSDDATKPFPVATGDIMVLLEQMNGGIVFRADLAVRIAEALCEGHRGTEELERQRPSSPPTKAPIGASKEVGTAIVKLTAPERSLSRSRSAMVA